MVKLLVQCANTTIILLHFYRYEILSFNHSYRLTAAIKGLKQLVLIKNLTKASFRPPFFTKTVLSEIRTEYHHQNQWLALVGLLSAFDLPAHFAAENHLTVAAEA